MYNHGIDTFISVGESGSFTKAAESLHLSSTGVMKQIAALEEDLGVKLFHRNSKGVILTENGKVFFRECYRLIDVFNDVVKRTKHASSSEPDPIRIGFSHLAPLDTFNRICQRSPKLRAIPISIVSYATDINTAVPSTVTNSEVAEIGFGSEKPEFFVDTEFYPFFNYRITCAVPASHPLATKRCLQISDLEGETLFFPSRGNNSLSRRFALSMQKNHPEITVETPSLFYDLEIFNKCTEEKKILISTECWDAIHPGLINLPVDWDWTMPFGLLWKKNSRKEVLDFIEAFKEAAEAE